MLLHSPLDSETEAVAIPYSLLHLSAKSSKGRHLAALDPWGTKRLMVMALKPWSLKSGKGEDSHGHLSEGT